MAIIVATTNSVTIYDGDDPDLPMWMIFNGNASNSYIGYAVATRNLNAVTMKNGIMCSGGALSYFASCNFIKESGTLRLNSANRILHSPIADRSGTMAFTGQTDSTQYIVDNFWFDRYLYTQPFFQKSVPAWSARFPRPIGSTCPHSGYRIDAVNAYISAEMHNGRSKILRPLYVLKMRFPTSIKKAWSTGRGDPRKRIGYSKATGPKTRPSVISMAITGLIVMVKKVPVNVSVFTVIPIQHS